MNDPALILVFPAAGFLILGGILYNKGRHLMKRGRRAQAIIFKNTLRFDNNLDCYYPVVRFLTERNEWITHELSIGYSTPKPEGSKVEVIYDPLDPTVVEINSPLQLEVLPKIFLYIGTLFLLIALGLSLSYLF